MKLVGTTPFVFAEAKLWILALEIGVGPGFSETSSAPFSFSGIDLSLSGKIYPIEIMNFSPYLGFANTSSNGAYNQSRMFGGVEFDFPGESMPLSAFAGGGLVFTEAEGAAGLGWHLGVKYRFGF